MQACEHGEGESSLILHLADGYLLSPQTDSQLSAPQVRQEKSLRFVLV
jgi:hypothetical protein